MAWHQQEQIEQLMENWGRWAGNGGVMPSGGGSALAWADVMIDKRNYTSTIPVLGGEAADTQAALTRMDEHLAAVLINYYTGSGKTVKHRFESFNQVRPEKTRIAYSTYMRQIGLAHVQFDDRWRSVVGESRSAGAQRQSYGIASKPRLVSTPKLGVHAIDNGKTNGDNGE